MRKVLSAVLSVLLMLLLCSCTGERSIDELLTAPPLSEKQSAVLQALADSAQERIALVFPATGSNRAAIREDDLDHDGVLEIIAFYSGPTQSLYAHVAVLEPQQDGSYAITASAEGLGSDIASCSYIDSDPAFRVLLIEWSNPGKIANDVAAYTYTGDHLLLGFEENCTDLLVLDLDTDGHLDFCYITPPAMDEPFSLKYVKLKNAQLTIEGQRYLANSVISVRSVSEGTLADGTTAVFIDEQHQNGLQTEVFLLTGEGRVLPAVFKDGYDILLLSQRADNEMMVSRTIGDVCCFPSDVAPYNDILDDSLWHYWYTLSEGSVVPYRSSYISDAFRYSLCVPDAWLVTCLPVISDAQPNTLRIYDTESAATLLTLSALSVNEDAAQYIDDGYSLISSGGGYRYYAKFNCSDEDVAFIRNSFFTL
ncbi:MAG: hypothetical protein IJP01_00475 [Oscillospiraceae bacterium]|nr:hypothetical protein [Oscillospiraceae bacterium]